jgi:hypothetical protein
MLELEADAKLLVKVEKSATTSTLEQKNETKKRKTSRTRQQVKGRKKESNLTSYISVFKEVCLTI